MAIVEMVRRHRANLYGSNAKASGTWMSGLETRAACRVVTVATANKLVRISWAVLASGNDYHPQHRALAVSNWTKWFFEIFIAEICRKEEDEHSQTTCMKFVGKRDFLTPW